MIITLVDARQILDSRGNPTVECRIALSDGSVVVASVPSGASVGRHEATELRDGGEKYHGKGVMHAVHNIKNTIAPSCIGQIPDVIRLDKVMHALDGTAQCSNLGANAMLAVSIALVRAQAHMEKIEPYQLINGLWGFPPPTLPRCMFNVINGGAHAAGDLLFQEFLLIPNTGNFNENLMLADELYYNLKIRLEGAGWGSALGDEGGFAPRLPVGILNPEEVILQLLTDIVMAQKIATGKEVALGLDIAASQFYNQEQGFYTVHGSTMKSPALFEWFMMLGETYPIISLEDAFAEDDWAAWCVSTKMIGAQMQLVGDDLFATNVARIKEGVRIGAANAVLIKPNQIGSVSGAVEAIQYCQQQGLATIVSHRSGETDDTFIADLAVGSAAGQLKTGAPARGERVAKYNRLLLIADQLGL
jgi:enolase